MGEAKVEGNFEPRPGSPTYRMCEFIDRCVCRAEKLVREFAAKGIRVEIVHVIIECDKGWHSDVTGVPVQGFANRVRDEKPTVRRCFCGVSRPLIR